MVLRKKPWRERERDASIEGDAEREERRQCVAA